VSSEGWGESFDGCVAKYCARFSKELGLSTPIEQNYSMCLPDLIWLIRSRFIEKVSLPSKIRFYLFEDQEASPWRYSSILFDTGDPLARLDIPLDPSNVEFYLYPYSYSLTLTPMERSPRRTAKACACQSAKISPSHLEEPIFVERISTLRHSAKRWTAEVV